MYGSSLNFSSVTLPGVGGQINASNAITSDQLAKMNKSGKKWAPDASGGMSHHNEGILAMNAKAREKRMNLVNREYNENASGDMAMKEIMERKKARIEAFKEIKKKEYSFSDDEMLSIPQPFASSEKCKCGGSCPKCIDAKQREQQYREWSTEKRNKLKEGKIEGEFAGPNMSFPISSPADVSAAWSSVGRAPNPRQVMANIIKIAKKHGWEEGLPASVKQRLSEGKSGLPE